MLSLFGSSFSLPNITHIAGPSGAVYDYDPLLWARVYLYVNTSRKRFKYRQTIPGLG